jgi:subtilisin family serine protease
VIGSPLASHRSTGVSIEEGPLDLVKLVPLMERSRGRREIVIGLIDGPVATDHPGFAHAPIRQLASACSRLDGVACMHGTFVAGILSATRESAAPAICPGCTLLSRPIFSETASANEPVPSATPKELATAIAECVDAGARLLNLSASFTQVPSAHDERVLTQALDYAAQRGAMIVAAAGNQGTVGGTMITRHPAVVAVAACDRRGRPLGLSNLGSSIGRRGLRAPGDAVTSLSTHGTATLSGGTSVATPFVTGTLALVWSEFPHVAAARLRLALVHAHRRERPTVVPPLLDALATYEAMSNVPSGREAR